MKPFDTSFFHDNGTVPPGACYIERRADAELLDALIAGEFCYVFTSRQVGKSSLMVRTANKLRALSAQAVLLDLAALGTNATPEQWYDGMLQHAGTQIRLEQELDEQWIAEDRLPPVHRFFHILRDFVLPRLPGQIVIFVDEVDCIRSMHFPTDEFLAAIKECYNRRAEDPEFNRLTFCLMGVATPTDLIRDPQRNPFSLGRKIDLTDFTEEEAAPLAVGLQRSSLVAGEATPEARALLHRVLYWTNGHPYLTQRLCRAIARSNQAEPLAQPPAPPTPQSAPGPPIGPMHCNTLVDHLCEELFTSARARERDDNLLFIRERILRNPVCLVETLQLYGQLLGGEPVSLEGNHSALTNLRLAGLVRSQDERPSVRNLIYSRVFDLRWVLDHLEGLRRSHGDGNVNAALASLRPLWDRLGLERPAPRLKQITVLLASLSVTATSTDTSGHPPATELCHDLRGRLIIALSAHGGALVESTARRLTAVFGSALLREDEPDQAARAALSLRAEVRDFCESHSIPPGLVHLKVALHSGQATIDANGAVRSPLEVQPAFVVADRVLATTPDGAVVVSQDTYRRLRQPLESHPHDPLLLEGLAEPLGLFVVERARPRHVQLARAGIEGIETRMIGRRIELVRLQELYDSMAEDHELRIVTLMGDAGIGKSRLLVEFKHWLDTHKQTPLFLFGRALESMSGNPYALLRDALAFKFDIQDSDRPPVARKKLEDGLRELVDQGQTTGPIEEQETIRGAHFLGHLVGLDFSASPHLREILGDTRQIRERALHYLAEWFRLPILRSNARFESTVLVLEDLHWADDASLDLIDQVSQLCQSAPVFILGLTRPSLLERRPNWGEGRSNHTRLNLEPLSRRDCRLLVDEILRKVPTIPAVVRDLIVTRSEGNPFFLEELVKMLVDVRVIVPGRDTWSVDLTRWSALKVPETLAGVLQARLDHLSQRERTVLQRASVIGRVFWDTAIESFGLSHRLDRMPMAPSAVQDTLESLRRKDLICRREASAFTGATEYVFRHALLHDVIYESVLSENRHVCHAQAASWLIEQSGERAGEFAAAIAGHFESAGNLSLAGEWYGRAAAQAKATWAPRTAIGYYELALSYLARASPADAAHAALRRIEWLGGLGEALVTQAHFTEAEEVYRRMLAAAEGAGDLVAAAQAWSGLAFVQERQGANRMSVAAAARATELAAQAGESHPAQMALARALFLQGWAHYRLGNPAAVLDLGSRTLQLCKQLGARSEMVNGLKLMAVGHLFQGQFDLAASYFEHGLALARALGDRRNISAMLSNLGETARMRGEYRTAIGYYEEAIVIAREIGSIESELLYASNLGGARVALGTAEHLQAAEQDLRRVLQQGSPTSPNTRPPLYFSETHRFLAESLLGQHREVEAFDHALTAVQLAIATENQEHLAGAWRALGLATGPRTCRHRLAIVSTPGFPPPESPATCFERSLNMCCAMGSESERARTLLAWSNWDRLEGRIQEADQRQEQARSIFRRLTANPDPAAPRSHA